MSWDDDGDDFYAQLDVDRVVQQARAGRPQQAAAAGQQAGRPAAPIHPQPPQQQHNGSGSGGAAPALGHAHLNPQLQQPAGGPASGPGLRSLFTGPTVAGGSGGGAPAGGQQQQQQAAMQRWQPPPQQQQQAQAAPAPSWPGPGAAPSRPVQPTPSHLQQGWEQPNGHAPGPSWQQRQGQPAQAPWVQQLPQQQAYGRPQASMQPQQQQWHQQVPQPQVAQAGHQQASAQQQWRQPAQPASGQQQQQQWRPQGQQAPPAGSHASGPQQHRPAGSHASGPQAQQQQRPAAGSGPGSGAARASGSGPPSGPLHYVTLELTKDQMIEVKCSFREAVSEALKRVPGGLWDARSRHWRFPFGQYDRIVEVLQGLKTIRISLEKLAPIVSDVLKAAAAFPDDSERYCHLPASLEQQLMPFQREGIKFALRHGGRALIGDEMGLGKTVQAIAIAACFRDEWPVLIVTPSSLREAWADALHRWLGVTASRMHVVHSNKDASTVPAGIDFLIVSYNFIQKMELGKRFGLIICDEAHFLKEASAQRTKATLPLIKETRRAILLSGTPALNKPKELFNQLSALVPKARLKMAAFGERYCQGGYNHFDKYGGASNLAELNAMLNNSVMVRRLKREVLTQLPKKRRQQVMLDLDDDAKKRLAGLQKQLDVVRQVMGEDARKNVASGGAAGGGGAARMEQNGIISQLYKATAEVKAAAVADYCHLLLDNAQKFLVFGHHTSMLDAIEHACNRYKGAGKGGIKYIRIDGSTPPASRQALVNKFQENEDHRVAILSIKAAGTGLTLTAASTVVFAEQTWVPGETIQAEDRAHRIGQASSVMVYFLHARGSIDDLIWQSLQNKLDNVGEALDGEAQALDAKRVEAPDKGQRSLPLMLATQAVRAEQAGRQQGIAAFLSRKDHNGGGQQQQQQAENEPPAKRKQPG